MIWKLLFRGGRHDVETVAQGLYIPVIMYTINKPYLQALSEGTIAVGPLVCSITCLFTNSLLKRVCS